MAETSSENTITISDYVLRIAQENNFAVTRVMAVAKLLAEGATVPFIARYRKEATGEWTKCKSRRFATASNNSASSTPAALRF
ncbi:MAG: hypothetical protein IJY80_03700 [Opitutales bacterium]|nr:hypothetical protein [Opitutales bacterium]